MNMQYIRVGDYYIPDLELPQETRPIDKWRRMHRDYLRERNPIQYNCLLLSGELWTYITGVVLEETGYIILDVRTAQEYCEKHIPGAINIANESIGTEEIPELPDKDQLILVYCRSGNRSKQASEKLVKLGYTNIVEIGGINSWPGETVTGDQ